MVQSEEMARSSIGVQDAAWFGRLGKRKSYRRLLDPRRK